MASGANPKVAAAPRRFRGRIEGYGALSILMVVALFCYVDRALVSVLQEPIKVELGLSDTQLGMLTGLAFALFYSVAGLPLGVIVDRVHRVRLLAASLAIWTIMTALSSVATGFLSLLLFRIGLAIGEATYSPGSQSLLADYFERQKRGRIFAIWALAPPLGVMAGIFIAGSLSASVGWRNTFLYVGLSGLLIVPLLLLLREPQRGGFEAAGYDSDTVPAAVSWRDGLAKLWSFSSFRYLAAGATLQAFVVQAVVNWTPAFYLRVHGMTLNEVAFYGGLIVGAGGALGAVLGGALLDPLIRRDERWYGWFCTLTVSLLVPIGLFHFLVPDLFAAMISGLFVIALCHMQLVPVVVTAQSLVPATIRGFTAAVLGFMSFVVGAGLGPLLTGMVSDLLSKSGFGTDSLRYALSASLIASVFAAYMFSRVAAKIRHDLRRTEDRARTP